MSAKLLPTTSQIREAFDTEVADHGGSVTDVYDDGQMLFIRSTLPETDQVRPRDFVQSGIALRTNDREVSVHPYVFRQVCRNGAIWACTTDSRQIERVDFAASSDRINGVLEDIRETITEFAQGSSFSHAVDEMRAATETDADMNLLLQLLPHAAHLGSSFFRRMFRDIARNFEAGRDRSGFGLMNAVTSVARDTRDPEQRWQLEELGGGVPALVYPSLKPSGAAADLVAT